MVCLYWIMLSAGRTDLGQLVEFLDVCGIDVHPERVLRLILYHFQGSGVDDLGDPERRAVYSAPPASTIMTTIETITCGL